MKALKIIPAIIIALALAAGARVAALDFSTDGFFTEPVTGFSNETVIGSGLIAPLALGFLPDNRMLVLEKGGLVLVADPESGQSFVYLDISARVNSGQERGLLDIAIPPDFDPVVPGKNLIYLYYTRSAGTDRAVIASYEHLQGAGGLASTADAGSEVILWTDTDGYTSCCHYGGGLDFGPDGKIWLTTSDKFNTTNSGEGPPGGADVSADLLRTSGKVVRINRDGTIPDGTDPDGSGGFWPANPYFDGSNPGPYPLGQIGAGVAHPSVWSYGLRNPFRADWDEMYGYFYIGEVGGNQAISWDDIHLASLDQPGVFFGWNFYEGEDNVLVSSANAVFDPVNFPGYGGPGLDGDDFDLGDPATGDYYSAPIYAIPHTSLTGGFVYRGTQFPDVFDGVYFFGNYEDNYIQFLELDATGTFVEDVWEFKPSDVIPGDVTSIVYLEEGIDGALYYVNYSATGGQVQRIVYAGNEAPSIDTVSTDVNQGDPPLTVTFSATVSDADNAPGELTYELSFDDGSPPAVGVPTATGPNTGTISVAHTYTLEGSYSASLLVTDGTKSTLSPPLMVTVGDPNDPPQILSASADVGFVDPGVLVTFSAMVDDPDPDDPPESLTCSWDFGDLQVENCTPNALGEVSATHSYINPGSYNASLTISDGEAPAVRSADIPIQVGAPSQLPVLLGLVFQVESFIKVGTSGTTVTEWLDESGFGNNLTAMGTPQYALSDTPSGLPSIVLNGNGDYFVRDSATAALTGLPAGADARTMFFVVDYEDVINNEFAGLAYGKPILNQTFGLTLDGNQDDLTIQGWGGAFDRTTDVDGVIDPANGSQRGFISHAVVYDPLALGQAQGDPQYKHYLNGALIDSGDSAYNTVVEKLLIGQNLDGGETPMRVAAAFIYDRALDQNEFDAVEAYIQVTYLTGGVNTPPNASDDVYFATSGETLTVPVSTGLLSNDTDNGPLTLIEIDGQAVTNGEVVALANGTLTIESNGAFSYTSIPAFSGLEIFDYTVSDGGQTDIATVAITVVVPGANILPVTDGLVAQLESDFNVIENNGVVNEWLSGAGTNMDLVASGDPRFVLGATPSGQAAISLDGGLAAFGEDAVAEGDKLGRTSPEQSLDALPVANEPRTMYFVVDYKAPNGTFAGVSYGKGAPNAAFGLVLNGNPGALTVQAWSTDFPSAENGIGNNDGSAGDDWFVHAVRYNGTTFRHYRDDLLLDTENFAFATVVENFVIGEEVAGFGFSALDVAAVLIYDKELDDIEHAQTVQYLTQKYLVPSALMLVTSSTTASYAAVGDPIDYEYLVTNNGAVTLAGPLTINDDKTGISAICDLNVVGNLDADLDPGEAVICTATYLVIAADITTGSVTNVATASAAGGTVVSNPDSVTVNYVPSPPGTLVQLPFNEGTGTNAGDVSGNGNDGTLSQGASFSIDTPTGDGFALALDGVDDVVNLDPVDVSGDELTLAAWFKADSFPGINWDPRLISKATSTHGSDHVFMLSTIKVGAEVRLRARVSVGGTVTPLIATSVDLNSLLDAWTHAAATYDGANLRLYVNGNQVGITPLSGDVDQAPGVSVSVGGQPAGAGARFFDGLIDDAIIAERAFSAAEIGVLASGAQPLPELRLDKSSTTTSYSAVGQLIAYEYLVSNTGNVPLVAAVVTVNDDKVATVTCPAVGTVGNLDGNLDVGEAVTCTATYTVTQIDVGNGSVTNVATASAAGGAVVSDPDSVTVNYVPSPPGTLVQLPFNEGTGTNAGDVSGNGNDGTLSQGASFSIDTPTGDGFALALDGVDDVVNLDPVDVSGDELTLAAWFKADSFPGINWDPRLISKATSTQGSDHVFMLSTIKVGAEVRLRARVSVGGTVTPLIATSVDLNSLLDTWTHAAATYDGANLRLYVNGNQVGITPLSGDVDQAPGVSVSVGGQPAGAGARFFDGLIDDAIIAERAFSAAEIGVLASGAQPLPELRLDKSSTTTSYSAVGQLIAYEYLVSNTGNVTLLGPVSIDDDKVDPDPTCPDLTTIGDGDGNLDVGESVTCTASFAVTQGDITTGSLTNVATASAAGGAVVSNPDSVTVNALQSPPGTLVQLPFNEGTGTNAGDVSGNGNDGTLSQGASFSIDTPDGSAFALALDGVDDVVNLAPVNVNGEELTLAAWFKAKSFPGINSDPRLISKATSTQGSDHVFMLSATKFGTEVRLRARVSVGGTVTTLIAASVDLNSLLDTWTHAAATYDGANLRLFVNGGQVGITPLSGDVDQAPGVSVAIGGQPAGGGARFFDGLIDDAIIAERAFSAAEINTLAGN